MSPSAQPASPTAHRASSGKQAVNIRNGPCVPDAGDGSLAAVLGSVAGVLGVADRRDRLGLDPDGTADRVCTVLVDGLGARLLAERSGHAPFLRSLARSQPDGVPTELAAVAPTTTAANLTSLGTGAPAGRHGLLGYQVRNPDTGSLVNHLRWPADLDPRQWQPLPTELERLAAAGVATNHVGPAAFAGSGLTIAGFRGASYTAAESLDDRVDASVALLARGPGRHVHLYWGDVDKVGHARGCGSHQWSSELERIDAALATLARRMPAGTVLVITADHGMVDADRAARFDLATRPELRRDVSAIAGEPRFVHLHAPDPERAAAVETRWREALGERAWVRSRAAADAEGWFGGLTEQMAGRVGDVVVAARGLTTVVDTANDSANALAMVGQHGSLTEDEVRVPLLRAHRG